MPIGDSTAGAAMWLHDAGAAPRRSPDWLGSGPFRSARPPKAVAAGRRTSARLAPVRRRQSVQIGGSRLEYRQLSQGGEGTRHAHQIGLICCVRSCSADSCATNCTIQPVDSHNASEAPRLAPICMGRINRGRLDHSAESNPATGMRARELLPGDRDAAEHAFLDNVCAAYDAYRAAADGVIVR